MSTTKEGGVQHPRHKALLDGTPYRGRSVMDLKARKKKAVAEVAPAKEESSAKKAEVKTKKKDDKKEEKK